MVFHGDNDKWFIISWMLIAILFPFSLSWVGILLLIGVWGRQRLALRRHRQEVPRLQLPQSRVVTLWRILLVLMAFSAVDAASWSNALGTTLAFGLASYFGLASARYLHDHQEMIPYFVKPLGVALIGASLYLIELRLSSDIRVTIGSLNPNLAGTLLLFGMGAILGYVERFRFKGIPLLFPFLVVTALGIFSTESRGALIGFAVMLAIYFARSWRRVLGLALVTLVSLALFLVGLIPIRLNPDPGRSRLWEIAVSLMQANPWNGIGLNNFWTVTSRMAESDPTLLSSTHAHNIGLQVGAEVGVPGLFVFVLLIATIATLAIKAMVTRPDSVTRAYAAAFLGLIIREQVDVHMFYVTTLDIVLWLVIGLMIVRGKEGDDAQDLRGRPHSE